MTDLLIGCIADDFTGATDIALMLSDGGMNVQLVSDLSQPIPADTDAVVVALKSRTNPVEQAIADSLQACDWLRQLGAQQLYFKYCSTFDSSDRGNIGPVALALAKQLGESLIYYVPSFPANGRTLYQAHLFVGDLLISDTHMRDHPLTPMRQPDMRKLLASQLPDEETVAHIPLDIVRCGAAEIEHSASQFSGAPRQHLLVDAVSDADLHGIALACHQRKLITGGSALAYYLPENFRRRGLLAQDHGAVALPKKDGAAFIIAGSCSKATLEQVERARQSLPCAAVNIQAIARGESNPRDTAQQLWQLAENHACLLYSSATAEQVQQVQQQFGGEAISSGIETFFARVAAELHQMGARKFVVAGGETSGAVSKALDLGALKVGPRIAAGVPWMLSNSAGGTLVALKSGNFGGPDFFTDALEMLP